MFNRAGVRLKRDGADWTITTVYPDNPAAAAGLAADDRIATIDRRTPDQLNDETLNSKPKEPVWLR